MRFIPTDLAGPVIVEPVIHGDSRGFFVESWTRKAFEEAGIHASFVQDNHSRSARGVLRGLHYQLGKPQGKLVRVTRGAVFDVAVDLRRSSPDFGRWTGVLLSGDNKKMLWIPPGFAHGFLALEDETDFLYKCTDYFSPGEERAIAWNDPDIAIDWPLGGLEPIVSERDRNAPRLANAEVHQ
jgi:dTDP-4-dehydrorhamnose 3,5-epimerase